MRGWQFFALLNLAACGVKQTPLLIESENDARPISADARPDARVDATPDAARPCTEGDQQAVYSINRHCYSLFKAAKNHVNAKAQCAAVGANLASLTTDDERKFVAASFGDVVSWIGANDEATEDTFVWETGEPFTTTLRVAPWRVDLNGNKEPNNGGPAGNEDCVVMQGDIVGDFWDDRPCTLTYAFVCER
jgi:hypothetical protein